MPSDVKAQRAENVMTLLNAAAAADSYAKRYLVKDIFTWRLGAG